MSTFVVVNTYTHSVTYVTDKMLMSLKEIIRCSGLSPEKFVADWKVLQRGISTWLTGNFGSSRSRDVYKVPRQRLASSSPIPSSTKWPASAYCCPQKICKYTRVSRE